MLTNEEKWFCSDHLNIPVLRTQPKLLGKIYFHYSLLEISKIKNMIEIAVFTQYRFYFILITFLT